MSDIIDPDACATMAEVRAGVDALDRALVTLVARRFGYMRAAARIKPSRDQVRDEARKSEVIHNAAVMATTLGAPVDAVRALWDELVEASIAYELASFDARRS